MKATAELQVIPVGEGVSVRQQVMRVVELLQGHGFTLETHASGTNIEGELTDILAVVEQIHETLHREGSVRLVSYLKLETRIDKVPMLAQAQNGRYRANRREAPTLSSALIRSTSMVAAITCETIT
jgi:uncharacterized protein (TIGR00106 family)